MKATILDFLKRYGLLVIFVGSVAGCASTEPENLSERPWNAPKSWEHGIPTSIMEGR